MQAIRVQAIPHTIRRQMAQHLECGAIELSGWKLLAEKFGFPSTEISLMDYYMPSFICQTNTERVLLELSKRGVTVARLMSALQDINPAALDVMVQSFAEIESCHERDQKPCSATEYQQRRQEEPAEYRGTPTRSCAPHDDAKRVNRVAPRRPLSTTNGRCSQPVNGESPVRRCDPVQCRGMHVHPSANTIDHFQCESMHTHPSVNRCANLQCQNMHVHPSLNRCSHLQCATMHDHPSVHSIGHLQYEGMNVHPSVNRCGVCQRDSVYAHPSVNTYHTACGYPMSLPCPQPMPVVGCPQSMPVPACPQPMPVLGFPHPMSVHGCPHPMSLHACPHPMSVNGCPHYMRANCCPADNGSDRPSRRSCRGSCCDSSSSLTRPKRTYSQSSDSDDTGVKENRSTCNCSARTTESTHL